VARIDSRPFPAFAGAGSSRRPREGRSLLRMMVVIFPHSPKRGRSRGHGPLPSRWLTMYVRSWAMRGSRGCGCRGSMGRQRTCSDFLRRFYWLSSALERAAFRQRSAIRTATTPITTAHSTLPMCGRTCSLTHAVTCWEIVPLIWLTRRPAFEGGRSRCDFRGRRRYASHRDLLGCSADPAWQMTTRSIADDHEDAALSEFA
jgi:hypothetical protein